MIGRIDFDDYRITLPDLNLSSADAKSIKRIFITACGTALHAAWLEKR
jgi:glucosamine--fructose-6-phosphate aminotransferase (isomerizing)